MERTRIQAFKELRTLLSEVLASAVADDEVPEAFKSALNWERLISQTETRLAEGWRQRFDGEALDRRQEPRALFLLPDDEHGQQVLSERFVNEVSDQARGPLGQLDRQLDALSGGGYGGRADNPLGPTAWAEGIRGGMKLIDCTPGERDWLMERLMPLLSSRIGLFYSALNTRLGSAGDGDGSGRHSSAASAARSDAYQPDLVPMETTRLLGGGEAVQDAVGEGFDGDSGGRIGHGGDGSVTLDRLFGLLSARRGPVGDSGYVTMPAYPVAPGFARSPGTGELSGTNAGVAVTTPWSQGDIFSILSLLQHSYATAAGGAGVASMGRLQEAMSSTASQLGLSGAIEAMPAPAQDLLELVGMLFEALLDGRRLDEKARTQLARLIIPYVRVAMLDRRMFMQANHPARRVLSQLVEAFETAAPEVTHYRPLRDLAFHTVERIAVEFTDDLGLFDRLEGVLAAELDACRRRADMAVRRAADAQSGQERRLAARVSVASFLRQAIAGKTLPRSLLEFLAGHWQHHQNIMLLREGEAGEGVALNRGLLRDLLRCNDKGELSAGDALRTRMEVVVASSGEGFDAVDEALAEIGRELAVNRERQRSDADVAEALAVQSEKIAALEAPPAAREAASHEDLYLAPDVSAAVLPVESVERYRQMPIGTWLDFVGDDGRVSSAHISWTSPISGRRILSNRRGQRILVASAEELAEMEAEGRIRPRQSESAFDQAMQTIADQLESGLAGAPSPSFC